jgi:hypothetical protein
MEKIDANLPLHKHFMKEYVKFYLKLIGHILIDGIFLVLWVVIIYVLHKLFLPKFHIDGLIGKMIESIASLMDFCVGLAVVTKTIKDTQILLKHIINES